MSFESAQRATFEPAQISSKCFSGLQLIICGLSRAVSLPLGTSAPLDLPFFLRASPRLVYFEDLRMIAAQLSKHLRR